MALQWEEIDSTEVESGTAPYIVIERAWFEGVWLLRTTTYTWDGKVMSSSTSAYAPNMQTTSYGFTVRY